MKIFLRSQIERRLPTLFNSVRAIRNRRYFRRQFSQLQESVRNALFSNPTTVSVQSGPFRGLRYFDETVWGSITPKWLGSYEAELHRIITQVINRSYTTIIDVGCAEGYYAVGLAAAMPTVKVIAFDTDFFSRRQIRRLAKLNQVADRIQVGAFCNHSELDICSHGHTLVVCDIEGHESQLLNPELAGSLYCNDILVEIHEASDSSVEVEQSLQSRFAASHRIERITATSRDAWLDDNLQYFPKAVPRELLKNAIDENRTTGRVWLWMQANRS